MNSQKIISLTLAQFRMLGRAIRGQRLYFDRYKLIAHGTVAALVRKGCLHSYTDEDFWQVSKFGRDIYACRGAWRPGDTVWDSASHEEREAYWRTQRHATERDAEIVARLQARMRAAGELADETTS